MSPDREQSGMIHIDQLTHDDVILAASFRYRKRINDVLYYAKVLIVFGVLVIALGCVSSIYIGVINDLESMGGASTKHDAVYYAYKAKAGMETIYVGTTETNTLATKATDKIHGQRDIPLTAKEFNKSDASMRIAYPGIIIQDEEAVAVISGIDKKLHSSTSPYTYGVKSEAGLGTVSLPEKTIKIDEKTKLNSMRLLNRDISFMVKKHMKIPDFLILRDNFVMDGYTGFTALPVHDNGRVPHTDNGFYIGALAGLISLAFFGCAGLLFLWSEFAVKKYNSTIRKLLIKDAI